jgi:hypothetical protein
MRFFNNNCNIDFSKRVSLFYSGNWKRRKDLVRRNPVKPNTQRVRRTRQTNTFKVCG